MDEMVGAEQTTADGIVKVGPTESAGTSSRLNGGTGVL